MGIPYTVTPTSVSLVIGFRPTTIPSSHPNFDALRKLVSDPNTTERDIEPLLNIPKAIETFTGGNVTVVNGRLYYRGYEVKNSLAQVILNFVKAGQAEAAKPFERFMEKAFQNPDPRAVEGLYDWVVAGGLPITPDGDILAWKAVQQDFYSIRAGVRGKLRHMIGDVVEEPRHETDGDPDRTCSRGIHFCSVEYLKSGGYASGGSRIMAVTISPTDVVAFPKDYNLSKGRCCKLTVVGEVPQADVPSYYSGAAPVYSGWKTAATVETPRTPHVRFPVQVGDVWKTRDGDRATVLSIGEYTDSKRGKIATTDRGMVWASTGQQNACVTRQADLVELISEGRRAPRNAYGFAVGQVWANGNGAEETISSITETAGIYTIRTNLGVYTERGRFNSDAKATKYDLTRLVKDVV